MTGLLKKRWLLFAISCALLAPTAEAQARGGQYAFDGGTAYQQLQVKRALATSHFDWDLVPRATVHIKPGLDSSYATPGHVYLDANLLNAGMFSWGVVQHEYAHLVDFALFDDALRSSLLGPLGATSWWGGAHGERGGERFASTLAWSYWPVSANVMKPQQAGDESSAMAPRAFRAFLKRTLVARGVAGAERLPVTLPKRR